MKSETVTTGETEPGFETFGLSERVMAGVAAAGYKTPTPIQTAAIPVVLAGRDLIAQARTGTARPRHSGCRR